MQKSTRKRKNREIIVANTDADFNLLFRASALIAVFMTAADYEQFSDKNLYLTDALEKLVKRLFKKNAAEEHVWVGYDWWPDHTRHFESDTHCFTQPLFDGLCALLADEYVAWRIQVVVYEDISNGKTALGSVAIWSNKFLIDRKLYEWMVGQDFDFGTTAKPRYVDVDKKAILKPREILLDEVA